MALPTRRQSNEPAEQEAGTGPTGASPLAEIERLHGQIGSLLDGWGGLSLLPRSGFIPRADVEETDDAYLVELELPGVHKKEIDISVAGRRLTVSGERKEKERVGLLRRRTRSVGRFHYELVLPSPIDPDAVDATLDDGVLTVRVPKAAGQQPKRIEVG